MNETTADKRFNDEYKPVNKSLRDLLCVVFKHKGKISLISLIISIPAILSIVNQPLLYQSSAKILVKEGRENSTYTTAVEVQNRIVDITRSEDVNSEIEILRSRLLAEQIVEKLGVDLKKSSDHHRGQTNPVRESLRRIREELKNLSRSLFPFLPFSQTPPPSFESAVLRVQKNLSVQRVKDSNVIRVSFSDTDKHIPIDIINTLLDFYLDHHLKVYKTAGAYQFFSEQTAHFKQILEESEKKLEEFKKKWSLAELQLEKEILVRQIGDYENDVKNTESVIEEIKKRLIQEKGQLKNQKEKIWLSQTARRNPLVSQLQSQLSQLKLQEKKLLDKYIDKNHRKIEDIRKQIQEIELQIQELKTPIHDEVVTGLNTIYQSLTKSILQNTTELKAMETKKKNIENHLSSSRQKLLALNERELTLNQLVRQIKINEENYQLYRKKVEENRISDAMDIARFANISIIEPALVPLEPIPSSKKLKAFMAIILGLTAGLGLAFLSELMDHSVGDAEELESCLNLPVLGSIPDTEE